MPTSIQNSHTAWFIDWFGHELYSRIYSHRSSEEAQNAVAQVLRHISLPPGSSVLDLCCGSGRHVVPLALASLYVTGIDLSATLLDIAQQHCSLEATLASNETLSKYIQHIRLYRQDMRTAYPHAPFDCITNFFTSFGYFNNSTDDITVLCHVADALKPNGFFYFDYLNADYVRSYFVPHDQKFIGEYFVKQTRTIEDNRIKKTISVTSDAKRESMDSKATDIHREDIKFEESVRLYSIDECTALFKECGLVIHAVYGNYHSAPYTSDSPRMIIIAQKM
jgi:SAM-dependent methyltransferase